MWTQVGPSVNTFFIFHILRICNFLKFGNVNTLRAHRIFPSQPNLFQFVWISSNKIHSKINIFHTLNLKIVKWTLLNLTCWRLSNNITNTPQIPTEFSFFILFNFHWNTVQYSIASTQSQTKLVHPYSSRTFQRYQECSMKHSGWEISANKTK